MARYQAGVTLLHLDRTAEARDAFDDTERLAPGWYHVRSSRSIAAAVADGTLAPGAFAALTAMEGDTPRGEKVALAQAALEAIGTFPQLDLHLGIELSALGRDHEAVAAWRHALEGDPGPDIRTRLLSRLAAADPEPETSRALFRELLAIEDGNLVARAAAMLALAVEG
jgi:tetratricopeptide (TPR) repeat protein